MKIWKKIFVYSLVVFMIVLNMAVIIMVEKIYNRNLNIALAAAISEQNSIKNSIYLNSDIFNEYSKENLWVVLRKYIYTDIRQVKNIEIFDKNKNLIMDINSVKIDGKREELEKAHIDECKFIIRNINKEDLVFVSSKIKFGEDNYTLIVTKDITYVRNERYENYMAFIWIDMIVTLILGVLLYMISKNITNPIEELTEVSTSISKGEYYKRANYKSNDEIGILSENFNSMMQVIEDKIEELQEISEQKQRFIDSLTHEMKTPVTSIIGYSDLLMKGNINEEIKFKALQHINNQGKRLENLNNSLIKLIMMKNEELEVESISIKEVINNNIKALSYKLSDKDISVKVKLEDENIIGNKSLLNILISNILDNSIKASVANQNIIIFGKINKNKYELEIRDQGKGISKEELERVKEPFYMGDKSRATSNKNLGLGLAICNEICMKSDIDFHITSNLNEGTSVKLMFYMEELA